MAVSVNGSPTIVLVDDDKDIRDAVAAILIHEGYRVVAFENGRDALEGISQVFKPALVLLDLMMPTMNGIQFLEACRTHPILKDLPIYVLSGSSHLMSLDFETKVQGFLAKPFNMDVLLNMVARYVQRLAF